MPLLFDTNTLIHALAGIDPWAELLRKAIERRNLLISSVVVAEYLINCSPEEGRSVEALWNEFPVIPVDLAVAREAANIHRLSLSRKEKAHLADCLIAAQCVLSHAELATLNRKDFPSDRLTFTSLT